MWNSILYQLLIFGYIFLCSTTAATDNVYQSFIDILLNLLCHLFRSLVILSKAVRQAGIRIRAYIIRCAGSQSFKERFQLFCSERAVKSYRQYVCMLHRSKKSIKSLSGQSPSCNIGNCNRKHQRYFSASLLHRFLSSHYSCLGIQGIKNSFYENRIYPTINQCLHLDAVCRTKFIECKCTICRIIHIRTH